MKLYRKGPIGSALEGDSTVLAPQSTSLKVSSDRCELLLLAASSSGPLDER